MSEDQASREQTLMERVYSLPPEHTAVRELSALEAERDQLEYQIKRATSIAKQWAHSAGFNVEDCETLAEALACMRNQHCTERSYTDLAASGGIGPESP